MSNFDEWRSNFLISINSNGKFKKSFDQCLTYIDQIACFNQICNHQNETDSFLSETLKPAIDTILSFEITSENRVELGDITHFLQVVTVLLEWTFVNDHFNLFDVLNRITDPEMELYKSIKKMFNGKCDNLNEIKKFIVSHEYMTIMLMKIQKESNLKVDHYLLFFQTFNKINEFMNEAAKFALLYGLFEPYQNFLENLFTINIQDIKSEKLQELYSNFCILASVSDLDIFQGSIEQMTLLASNFFVSTDYQSQKLGSNLFKIFTETKSKQNQEYINHIFVDTLNKSHSISKILSIKLYSDLMPIISPLIDQISSNNYITGADLIEAWKTVINMPDNESNFNIVLNILKHLKFSEVDNFFISVPIFTDKASNVESNRNDQYGQNLQAFTKLAVEFLTDRDKIQTETTEIIFNKLFDSSDQYTQLTTNQPDDYLDLKKIYIISKDNKKNNNSNSTQIRRELIKVLHSRFNKEYNSFVLHLLTDIASNSAHLREDFDEKDINTLSNYISSIDSKTENEDDIQYSLYPLYTILINEYNKKISSKVLESMIKSPSDAFWDFLYQIIEKSQLKSFEDDAINELTNFILKNYMQKNSLFLDFLKLFILNMNQRCGSIDIDWKSSDNYTDFDIKKTPLLYEEEVLEKIIAETEDESTFKGAMDICFTIYGNYPDENLVVAKLLSLFKKYVEDENNKNVVTKINIITFIYEYCKKKDLPTKVSCISHQSIFKKSLNKKSNLKYTVNCYLPNDEKTQWTFNAGPSMHTLYIKIAPFLSSSRLNYYICRKNGKPLSLNDKIPFSTFSRTKGIIVKDVKDAEENDGENAEKKDEENGKKDENADKKGEKKDEKADKKDEKKDENVDKKDEKKDENADKKDEKKDENADKKDDKADDDKDDSSSSSDDDNDDDDEEKEEPKKGKKGKKLRKKSQVKVQGGGFFGSYKPFPSEVLIQHNVTKSLFKYLNHLNTPKLHKDENQKKLDELIYKVLSYLPTDPELLALSSSLKDFIPPQVLSFDYESFINNKYAMQYVLQVLLIRFNNEKYIDEYKDVIQQLLLRIISVDDPSLTLCTFLLTEMLRFIELFKSNSNDFILLLIKLLPLPSISDENKLKIVNLLDMLISVDPSHKVDISTIFCDHFDLFNNVLTSLSTKVWSKFKEIIFNMENPNKLFQIVLKSLIECPEEEMMNQINRYYIDIFSHFIIPIADSSNNSDEINNYVRIFMKMLQLNPTNQIIDSFQTIANKNADLLSSQDNECSLTKIIEDLINIVRLDSKPSMMNKVIELLIDLSSHDAKYQQQLNDFAEQIASYRIKSWNQMSEADQKNSNETSNDDDDDIDENNSYISKKDKGLKNNNQTCYFNSAIQQFYHIPAFRYFISNYDKIKDDDKKDDDNDVDDDDEMPIVPSLSSLFIEMEFSRKSEINPELFFTIFSSKHTDFELGKQQDAQEFVEYFLDDIKGKPHDLFEWTLLTKYNRLDDGQEISSNDETFVSIPLSVKSGSMNESIKEFFTPQKLTGENLYQASNGMKIESIVTQRIKVAPPVLIFQLKRFAYDKVNQNRVKINKKVEIPNTLSIEPYMLNAQENESYNYILNGVVVHAGNGTHGHYTSLIKEDIHSDNWIRYDDSSVDRIKTRDEFKRLAFGDESDVNDVYGVNGYLVFYVRENATVDVIVNERGKVHEEKKFILDNSFPSQISQQDELSITKDNNNFLFNQCVLEKSTFNFMMKCSTNIQLFRYFFGIFVHTKMFDKSKEINDKLIKSASITDSSVYLQFITDDNNFKDWILPVFSDFSPDKMESESLKVITKIITSSKDKELASKCVEYFIENLKLFHKKWNRVCDVGKLITEFIKNQDKGCIYAVKNCWEKLLLNYIFNVYEEKNINTRNINIEAIFDALSLIISSSPKRDSSCYSLYIKLPSINDKVKDSDDDGNKESYKELIMSCIVNGVFTVNDVVEALGNDFPRLEFILHHQIEKIEPDSFYPLFVSLISNQGFTAEEIIDDLYDSKKLLNSLFPSNIQLMVDILTFNQLFKPEEDLKAAEKLAKLLTKPCYGGGTKLSLDDEEEQNLFDALKKSIPSLEKAYPPFFTVFSFLINELKIPSDMKIEGLDELFAKSDIDDNDSTENDNTDMINIEIYFQPDKLTKRVIELLKQIEDHKETDSTFNSIIKSIEACESKPTIFAQMVSLPEWKPVIQKQSSSRDYTFISNLASTLCKIENKILSSANNNDDDIVRFSLVNALAYLLSLIIESIDNGDYRYYKNIPDLVRLIDESFKNSKKIINQNKGSEIEDKSEADILYIEPHFQVFLDFDSYLKIIEKIINDSKRNPDKDAAMAQYSQYIIHLIDISNKFAKSITDKDSDKLKQKKQFIERTLSSMKINTDNIFKPSIDNEKDIFILNLVDLTYTISMYNEDLFREMNNYIKKHTISDNYSFLQIFRLKFGLQELVSSPIDKCLKEIIQLDKKTTKHIDVFFELLIDVIQNCNNHELTIKVVSSLLTSVTQMTEKTFSTAQIRGDESNSIQERNFFENFLKQFTDQEFDDVLHQIHSNYSKRVSSQNPNMFDIMQFTTKLLVMIYAKPEKKQEIIKMLPDNCEKMGYRSDAVAKMILDFKV